VLKFVELACAGIKINTKTTTITTKQIHIYELEKNLDKFLIFIPLMYLIEQQLYNYSTSTIAFYK